MGTNCLLLSSVWKDILNKIYKTNAKQLNKFIYWKSDNQNYEGEKYE